MSRAHPLTQLTRVWMTQLVWLVAVLTGGAIAFAQTKGPAPATSTSSSTSGAASPSPAPATGPTAPPPSNTSGISPMPSGNVVPKAWLPPGADDPDPGPSAVIFPSQLLTLRMNHKLHVQGQNLKCVYCHTTAKTSQYSNDVLVPKNHAKCTQCHAIDETKPFGAVTPPGGDPKTTPTRCDFCHVGATVDGANVATVPKLIIPPPLLKMSHKAHADQNVECEACHGKVENLELATRDQLPRMKGCFGCHQSGDAGSIAKPNGNAKSECTTCHLADKSQVQMATMWPSGVLMPPKWLKNAKHGVDWIERHKKVAGAESSFCANCHKEQECVDCHDGKTKPQSIHSGDFLTTHPVAARFDQPKCSSCHSMTNFCVQCHTRVGVAGSSGSAVSTLARFHPPTDIWAGPIRKPGHHSFEAQKNINACVSCHVERDCVSCHGTTGVGGKGADPHALNFRDKCATAYVKNPRPCFVCHDPYDKELAQCK